MSELSSSIRERYQQQEDLFLCPQAIRSFRSQGRQRAEEECPVRTPFQRDRDRIVHSKSFRRLKRKTQVFFSPLGDHFRTRMTHTLEVSQIARTLARALCLNEDLVEAISLGHDLGHTPFGHAGESVLNRLYPAGFRHYQQSLRVVDKLEMEGRGLNLTWEVRDGILKHSKGMDDIFAKNPEKSPATLEGQLVRLSDILAYVNHDLDDAIRAQLIRDTDIPQEIQSSLGSTHSQRINTLVLDTIAGSEELGLQRIALTQTGLNAVLILRQFLNDRVYKHVVPQKELRKAEKILTDLFYFLVQNPQGYLSDQTCQEETVERAAVDFLAGMTDNFALTLYRHLFVPQEWRSGFEFTPLP